MTSQLLCLSTDLSSSDMAAWVQAIGIILAIPGSVAITNWQLRAERRRDAALRQAQEQDLANTILELAKRSRRAMVQYRGIFTDRTAIHEVAEGQKYVDIGMLQ